MAAMAVAQELSPLPSRLQRFFEKFPPQLFSAKFTGQTFQGRYRPESAQRGQLDSQVAAQTQEVATTTTSVDGIEIPAPEGAQEYPELPRQTRKIIANPFLPTKLHTSGKWRGPQVGLRIQADLVKLAKKYDVEELLPPGPKSTEYKQKKTLERGLRVRGTGEGQKVKGHQWERRSVATVQERIKAMENMPALIREWKQRGYGRGWKKYPSGKVR